LRYWEEGKVFALYMGKVVGGKGGIGGNN